MVLLVISNISAQQILGLSYNIGIPQAEMTDFIDNTSYSGFGVEGRQFINEQITMGLSFNWNKFEQQERNISGNIVQLEDQLLDAFPLTLNASYFLFKEASGFRPFGSMNLGAALLNIRGIRDGIPFKDKGLYFWAAPEIGFLAEILHDLNIMIMLRYNYNAKFSGSASYPYVSIHFTFVSVSIF